MQPVFLTNLFTPVYGYLRTKAYIIIYLEPESGDRVFTTILFSIRRLL